MCLVFLLLRLVRVDGCLAVSPAHMAHARHPSVVDGWLSGIYKSDRVSVPPPSLWFGCVCVCVYVCVCVCEAVWWWVW